MLWAIQARIQLDHHHHLSFIQILLIKPKDFLAITTEGEGPGWPAAPTELTGFPRAGTFGPALPSGYYQRMTQKGILCCCPLALAEGISLFSCCGSFELNIVFFGGGEGGVFVNSEGQPQQIMTEIGEGQSAFPWVRSRGMEMGGGWKGVEEDVFYRGGPREGAVTWFQPRSL